MSKQKHWRGQQFHIVTPSRWLGECASKSTLLGDLPIHVIPNGVDLDIFQRYARDPARDLFGLRSDKKLILFGAETGITDPRKGFRHIQTALERLAEGGSDVELVIFGHHDAAQRTRYPLRTHHVGFIRDERLMALLFAAVDVFVAPSTEDNLPNTVAEALACGTPCAAFNIGGMPDMVEHEQNGFLAEPFDAERLAEGILWILSDERWPRLSDHARKKAEEYLELGLVVDQYAGLYSQILNE